MRTMNRATVIGCTLIGAAVLGTALFMPRATAQTPTQAQAIREAYARADGFADRTQNLVYHVAGTPTWVAGAPKLTYRVSVKGGFEFELVDAVAATKAPAFDHAKLAAALSSAAGESYTALTLPFQTFAFSNGQQ